MNRDADADTTMDRAVRMPGTTSREVYAYGVSQLSAAKTQRALAIFKLNSEKHPDDKFWTSLGLARGFTAVGDKRSAIANWEIVLRNVPSNLSANVPAFEKALQALKAKG